MTPLMVVSGSAGSAARMRSGEGRYPQFGTCVDTWRLAPGGDATRPVTLAAVDPVSEFVGSPAVQVLLILMRAHERVLEETARFGLPEMFAWELGMVADLCSDYTVARQCVRHLAKAAVQGELPMWPTGPSDKALWTAAARMVGWVVRDLHAPQV